MSLTTKVNPVVRTAHNWHTVTVTPPLAMAYLLAKGVRFIVFADPVETEPEYLAKNQALQAFQSGAIYEYARKWEKVPAPSNDFTVAQAFFVRTPEGYFTMISTDLPSDPCDRLQSVLMGFKREDTLIIFEPTHESAHFLAPVMQHADALMVSPDQMVSAYKNTVDMARIRAIPLLAGGGRSDADLLEFHTIFEHPPTSIQDFFAMIRNHQCAPRVYGKSLGEEFEIERAKDPSSQLFPAESDGTVRQSPCQETNPEEDQGICCPS